MSGFSVKTFNSLLRAKVNTIGDLKALLSGESSDIKLSKSTIEELTRFLEERKNNSTEQ